tara:strand:- start:7145 stop:8002 length:858 start_codon:yes stop_codon:yes gene_type:complete
LDSIINQTYKNLEILIIDDFSSDNTGEIIKNYGDSRIRYIRHSSNKGLAQSRNTGMKNSNGEFIAFLDDDDEWLPDKIKEQLNVFKNSEFKNLGMVMCGMRRINGSNIKEQKEILRGNLQDIMLIDQPLVGNGSCALIKKEIFQKYGGFDSRYKRGIDGYYFSKISRNYQIDFCDQILVNYYEDVKGRISNYQNTDKVREAIEANFLIFDEIKDIIDRYPRLKARFNLRIAEYYILLNDYSNATKFFFKSAKRYIGLKKYLLFILYIIFPTFITNKLRQRRMHKD